MSADNSRRILGKNKACSGGGEKWEGFDPPAIVLATVTAGYKEASDCVWRAVSESRTGACVCVCVRKGRY